MKNIFTLVFVLFSFFGSLLGQGSVKGTASAVDTIDIAERVPLSNCAGAMSGPADSANFVIAFGRNECYPKEDVVMAILDNPLNNSFVTVFCTEGEDEFLVKRYVSLAMSEAEAEIIEDQKTTVYTLSGATVVAKKKNRRAYHSPWGTVFTWGKQMGFIVGSGGIKYTPRDYAFWGFFATVTATRMTNGEIYAIPGVYSMGAMADSGVENTHTSKKELSLVTGEKEFGERLVAKSTPKVTRADRKHEIKLAKIEAKKTYQARQASFISLERQFQRNLALAYARRGPVHYSQSAQPPRPLYLIERDGRRWLRRGQTRAGVEVALIELSKLIRELAYYI